MSTEEEKSQNEVSTIQPNTECGICTSEYTKKKRYPVKCLHCSFEACVNCHKSYILTKASPQCMGCNAIWAEEFLENHLSLHYIDTVLRKHSDDVLYQQEKSMFHVASREIENRKDRLKRESLQEEYNLITNRIEEKKHSLERTKAHYQSILSRLEERNQFNQMVQMSSRGNPILNIEYHTRQRMNLERDRDMILAQISDHQTTIQFYESKLETHLSQIEKFNSEVENKLDVTSKTIRCPKEKCLGYLNSKYECPVCMNSYCRDCQELLKKKEGIEVPIHKCDENLVKTLKSIAQNTKPCPNCKMPIEKINGCDQFFCTYCNTAFNWKTGEIEKGRIHNPHYFEWLQKNGGQDTREHQTNQGGEYHNPCGERITHNIIMEACRRNGISHEWETWFLSLFRFIVHIEEVRIRRDITTYQNRHLELRIKYVKGNISEEDWKKQLSKDEKEYQLKLKQRQLWETTHNVCKDILQKIINKLKSHNEEEKELSHNNSFDTYKQEVKTFLSYFNEQSKNILSRYGRRWYIRIDSISLNEQNAPIVLNEAPENYTDVIKQYMKPKDPTHEISPIDWMDEVEDSYFTIYKYYASRYVDIVDKTKNLSNEQKIQIVKDVICNEEYNIDFIKLESIIKDRVRSHPKGRVTILEYLDLLIKQIVKMIMLTIDSENNSFPVTWEDSESKLQITGGWHILILLVGTFPLHLFSFPRSFLDMTNDVYNMSHKYKYRNCIGVEDKEYDSEVLTNRRYFAITTEMHSISGLYLMGLYHSKSFFSRLSDQSYWNFLVTKTLYVSYIHTNVVIRTNKYQELPSYKWFKEQINSVYNKLLNQPKYSRRQIIKKEYRQIEYSI